MSLDLFNTIPLSKPNRSKLSLSHRNLLTMEMGYLYPVFCEPVLPSDRWKISADYLIRFAPLKAPILSEVDVFFHAFFVPNRIIWHNWEDFITGSHNGRKLPEDQVPVYPRFRFPYQFIRDYSKPNDGSASGTSAAPWSYMDDLTSPLANRSLLDYLDFQTWNHAPGSTSTSAGINYDVDALPVRAYQRIFMDYYMDENLYDPDGTLQDLFEAEFERDGILVAGNPDAAPTTDAQKTLYAFFSKRSRAWSKDYFTSALPWAQKGDDVLIPGSGASSASLSRSGSNDFEFSSETSGFSNFTPYSAFLTQSSHGPSSGNRYASFSMKNGDSVSPSVRLNLENFKLDSSSVGEGTIRELRRAFAAQKFLERRAVGGTRYGEQNFAFFGVRPSDARLQRAEFLGGMKAPVVVSQVLQTSETTDSSPLGQPGGNAVSASRKFLFDREFNEYGYIMVIMSVRPKADYMQGIPRKYSKFDVYDYYWPQFARIGEQEIKNSELYFRYPSTEDSSAANNDGVFGYSPRYAEYKYIPNRIHGDFKDSLAFWHLGRSFKGNPVLNKDFITCNPSQRIFAVGDYEKPQLTSNENHLWVEIAFNISALRPMPLHSESL